jgi:hypothetical protein
MMETSGMQVKSSSVALGSSDPRSRPSAFLGIKQLYEAPSLNPGPGLIFLVQYLLGDNVNLHFSVPFFFFRKN